MCAGEIWSLAVAPDQGLVAIGSAGADLQLYRVAAPRNAAATMSAAPAGGAAVQPPQSTANDADDDTETTRDDSHDTLRLFGSLARETAQRVSHVEFCTNGEYLAACSTGAVPAMCCVRDVCMRQSRTV